MNTHKTLACSLATLTALLMPFGAAQAADSGFYIGGSIGQAQLEVPSDVVDVPDFDEDDTGWKLFGGYNWNLAILNLGIEGGYVDFGAPTTALGVDSTLEIDASGWNVWGMGGVNIGPVDVYAKVGAISWDSEASIGGIDPGFGIGTLSDSGTDIGYGLGARVALGSLHIRGEWEQYDIEDTDSVYMFSLGLAWQFN
jgi:hypothetical protein